METATILILVCLLAGFALLVGLTLFGHSLLADIKAAVILGQNEIKRAVGRAEQAAYGTANKGLDKLDEASAIPMLGSIAQMARDKGDIAAAALATDLQKRIISWKCPARRR